MKTEHSKNSTMTTKSKTPLTDSTEAATRVPGFDKQIAEDIAWEHARKMEQLYNRERRRAKRLNRSIRRIHNEE